MSPSKTSTLATIGLFPLFPAAVLSQTSAFTDQATGIQFQRFFGARTNFGFGMALSTDTTSKSFIGQLSFPLKNGNGWGGWGLTGDMEGPLLLAAWSDGKGNVASSFRQAFNEDDNPPEVSGAFALRPIAEATSVNNTFLTYTFLCENCLDAGLGLAPETQSAEMGWALASTAVRNAGSSNGVLEFHDSGFGDFKANLAGARNADFAKWAALAGAPVAGTAGAKPFDVGAAGTGSGGDSDDEGDSAGGSGSGSGSGSGGSGGADSGNDSDSDDD